MTRTEWKVVHEVVDSFNWVFPRNYGGVQVTIDSLDVAREYVSRHGGVESLSELTKLLMRTRVSLMCKDDTFTNAVSLEKAQAVFDKCEDFTCIKGSTIITVGDEIWDALDKLSDPSDGDNIEGYQTKWGSSLFHTHRNGFHFVWIDSRTASTSEIFHLVESIAPIQKGEVVVISRNGLYD